MVRLTVWLATVTGAAVWLWSDVAWVATPEGQVMSIVRVVAAGLATWLAVTTVLAIAARVLRLRWLGLLAPAIVRRLVAGALAGGLLLTPGVAGATSASASGAATSPTVAPPLGIEIPVFERIDPPATPPLLGAPVPQDAAPVLREQDGVHVVETGDHLWGIAEMEVAARLGRAPTDAEVVPYWRQLIDANRAVVGRDPNLILPGQRIDLPS